jgi:FixJ family two-component response regulator
MFGQRAERRIDPALEMPEEKVPLAGGTGGNGTSAPFVCQPPLIRIIQNDRDFRAVLASLFAAANYDVAEYLCPRAFVEEDPHQRPGCLILDVTVCETSGLDFQLELRRLNVSTPVIFLTDQGDIRMTVRAMRAGAIDFLTKPYAESELLDAVALGISQDLVGKEAAERRHAMRERFARLTPRQREVLANVRAGMRNKQLAGVLGLTEITVKVHRAAAMRRLGVKSLVELVEAFELIED